MLWLLETDDLIGNSWPQTNCEKIVMTFKKQPESQVEAFGGFGGQLALSCPELLMIKQLAGEVALEWQHLEVSARM